MKNYYWLLVPFFFLCSQNFSAGDASCRPDFDFAASSGVIWKRDSCCDTIFGKILVDAITLDVCSYFWNYFGVGVKGSYWHGRGKTTALHRTVNLEEVPLIFYLRGIIGCKFQGYASIGGGVIFVRESSYLGKVHTHVGIAEVEVGLNYYFYKRIYLTTAFRVLFPRQNFQTEKFDFGGYGLRAGVGISY